MREVVWVIPTVARGVVVGCVDRQYERLLSRGPTSLYAARTYYPSPVLDESKLPIKLEYTHSLDYFCGFYMNKYIDPQTFELLWSVKVEEKKLSKYLLPF